jgi:hypothetical protein
MAPMSSLRMKMLNENPPKALKPWRSLKNFLANKRMSWFYE